MTREDFYIIRNSITMRQAAESYGFHIDRRGFIRCPFHAGGAERTPSLQIYSGYKGFYCRACGTGGDVIKFVQIYEGLSPNEAALELSKRFGIEISEEGEISPETRQKAQEAVKGKRRELMRQMEIRRSLTEIATLIQGYEAAALTAEPFSSIWCYIQNELPVLKGKWERLFSQLKKID